MFELYGDRALADALDIALKMTLAIPLADILAYRKVRVPLRFYLPDTFHLVIQSTGF